MGTKSKIASEVQFKGYLSNIRIGNNVRISGDVVFDCDQKDSKIIIGDNCVISGPSQLLTFGGYIELGENCSINPFCIVYGHGGLRIGNFVRIAAHTVIIPANHRFDDPNQPITKQGLIKKGISIDDDVWVASGVRILDGSKIGTGSILGCSAVVNSEIEPFSIVVGIPGKVIKSRKKND